MANKHKFGVFKFTKINNYAGFYVKTGKVNENGLYLYDNLLNAYVQHNYTLQYPDSSNYIVFQETPEYCSNFCDDYGFQYPPNNTWQLLATYENQLYAWCPGTASSTIKDLCNANWSIRPANAYFNYTIGSIELIPVTNFADTVTEFTITDVKYSYQNLAGIVFFVVDSSKTGYEREWESADKNWHLRYNSDKKFWQIYNSVFSDRFYSTIEQDPIISKNWEFWNTIDSSISAYITLGYVTTTLQQ